MHSALFHCFTLLLLALLFISSAPFRCSHAHSAVQYITHTYAEYMSIKFMFRISERNRYSRMCVHVSEVRKITVYVRLLYRYAESAYVCKLNTQKYNIFYFNAAIYAPDKCVCKQARVLVFPSSRRKRLGTRFLNHPFAHSDSHNYVSWKKHAVFRYWLNELDCDVYVSHLTVSP